MTTLWFMVGVAIGTLAGYSIAMLLVLIAANRKAAKGAYGALNRVACKAVDLIDEAATKGEEKDKENYD